MPATVDPESQPGAEPIFCKNGCNHALARTAKYCPYCGTDQAVEVTRDGRDSRSADIPKPNQGSAEVIQPLDTPTAPFGSAAGKGSTHELQTSRGTHFELALIKGKLPAAEVADSKFQARPGRSRLPLLVVVALAAISLFWVLFRFTPQPSPVVRVDAKVGVWTGVSINDLAPGAQIVMSGDGPFRVRTGSSAPILVDGRGGSTNLGAVDRAEFEVKSANERIVHVTIEDAGTSHP